MWPVWWAGARGWPGSLELRHDLPWTCAGRCEGVLFFDEGHLRVNAEPWVAGATHARMRGAGLGFNWVGMGSWQTQLQVAAPVGAPPALLTRRDTANVWLRAVRGF